MSTISKVSVNGVIYDLAGISSGGGYVISNEYSKIQSGDKESVLPALGGTEGYKNLKAAISEGTPIYIQLDNNLVPAYVNIGTSNCYISWYEATNALRNVPKLINTSAFIASDTTALAFVRSESELEVKRKLEVDIFDLTESSSNADIKAALKDTWDYTKAINHGIYQKKIGSEQGYIYAELGTFFSDVSSKDNYTVKISCNVAGCFGKEKGGIITINYSGGTFSVGGIVSF